MARSVKVLEALTKDMIEINSLTSWTKSFCSVLVVSLLKCGGGLVSLFLIFYFLTAVTLLVSADFPTILLLQSRSVDKLWITRLHIAHSTATFLLNF
ncbi:MAG: hypothetical protein MI674_07915 [Cytophagales bacterium]|nr:hypothetical protein [Cytophagales bacterium]